MVPAIVAQGGKWFSIGSKGNAGTKGHFRKRQRQQALPGKKCRSAPPSRILSQSAAACCGQEAEGGHPGRSVRRRPAGAIHKDSLTYDDLGKAGAILGSGLTVIDDSVNMADLATISSPFSRRRPAANAPPAGKASKRCASWWVKSARDRATAKTCPAGAHGAADDRRFLCALGKTVPAVITSTMKHFAADYDHYITGKQAAGWAAAGNHPRRSGRS